MITSTVFSRRRLVLLLTLALVGVIAAICGLRCSATQMPPSYRRAQAAVRQILFVEGRTLVRNELSELFASDDHGRSWRALSEKPPLLGIANSGEIWGAHGWPGIHEGPSAALWRSADRGETWSKTTIELAGARGDALYARLPAAFINEPDDAPLLVMSDFQLVRPALVADSSTWQRVGRPIPGLQRTTGTINTGAAGRQHRRSIYVASSGFMFFSGDDGTTWAREPVHPFFDARIRCRGTTCYALLSELGSRWSGLMTAEVGTNHWRSLRTFEVSDVAAALASDPRHAAITTFGADALLLADSGVYVAGIVDAGRDAWGAVLRVDPAGAITSVGRSVPEGLWVLEQAPDGTLWAGGQGAYRLQGEEWILAWSASNEQAAHER
jgi:hypothetical protein